MTIVRFHRGTDFTVVAVFRARNKQPFRRYGGQQIQVQFFCFRYRRTVNTDVARNGKLAELWSTGSVKAVANSIKYNSALCFVREIAEVLFDRNPLRFLGMRSHNDQYDRSISLQPVVEVALRAHPLECGGCFF